MENLNIKVKNQRKIDQHENGIEKVNFNTWN